jgi:DNA topoisomerase-2
MNYFTNYWPEIMEKNFVSTLLTPIVKVSYENDVLNFYNLYDFEDWKKTHENCSYNFKYYKGLGTSEAKDMKQYFENISKN